MVSKKLRETLLKQAIDELELARKAKEDEIKDWKANFDLYNLAWEQEKRAGRANVKPPYAFGFVETLLSKIKTYPNIKFGKGSNADDEKANLMTALYQQQGRPNAENYKATDLSGKKHNIFTGRTVFEVMGKSKPFRFIQNHISSFDFYIDELAGADIEKAMYCGNKGILLADYQLTKGVKDKTYIASEVKKVQASKVEMMADKDDEYTIIHGRRNLASTGRYEFLKWGTTDRETGERYYLLIHLHSNTCIRAIPLTDMSKADEGQEAPYWWYESWAAYPDDKKFWSKAPLTMVRNLIQLRIKMLNDIADATQEEIRPVLFYDANSIESPLLLDYVPSAKIPTLDNPNNSIWYKPAPSTEKAKELDEMLSRDIQLETGVTNDARGISDEDKVGIYEGNIANVQDRLTLLNDSYAYTYERLAMRFVKVVSEKLTTKVAVRILGKDGIKWRQVSRADLRARNNYDIYVEASETAEQRERAKIKDKLNYVANNRGSQSVNQTRLAEIEAELVGFDYQETRELLDVSQFGDSTILAEADRDIEDILDGGDPELNQGATEAYVKRINDYVKDEGENMKEDIETKLLVFAKSHLPIVEQNMIRQLKKDALEQGIPIDASGALQPPEENVDPTMPPLPPQEYNNEEV